MAETGVVFERPSETEVSIRDTVSHQQYVVTCGEPSMLTAVDETFPAPVTRVARLDTETLGCPESYGVKIRGETGEIREIFNLDPKTYTAGSGVHFLEIDAPVKTYIRVEGAFEYAHTDEEMHLSCEEPPTIGARAWRCYPQETITVSESPDDIIEALSYFGDAMLTSSPERSFPTLRGYPPELRVGDGLDVPSSLSKPDAGITITVPPDLPAALSVAPLAYYLLARVEPGERFSLRTADGFTYTPSEDTVDGAQSVLRTCFYLDCLVRTEGLYPFNLHAKNAFDAVTERDWEYAKLYEQSLPERTASYLRADTDGLDEVTAAWPLTALVEPGAPAVETLAYLAPELAFVKPADPPRYTGDEARRHTLTAFSRGGRDTRSTSLVFDDRAEFVDVPETGSQQTLWVGDGIPLNAGAVVPDGYRNQPPVARDEPEPPGLSVTVVCNEATMGQEGAAVQDILDPREDLPLELDARYDVTINELRRVLAAGTDHLHFVGHATPDGLECVDGTLDTGTLDENNVGTFFLNACQSFRQGMGLVETGSFGGIVTYGDVSDRHALETGGHICRLLNAGFPIGACHDIVRRTTPIGGQYTVVGNHGAILAHPRDGPPHVRYVEERADGYGLSIETYTGGFSQYKIGSVMSHMADSDELYLVPSTAEFDIDRGTLAELLSLSDTPLVLDGRLQDSGKVL